jgi:hypothetical protein
MRQIRFVVSVQNGRAASRRLSRAVLAAVCRPNDATDRESRSRLRRRRAVELSACGIEDVLLERAEGRDI